MSTRFHQYSNGPGRIDRVHVTVSPNLRISMSNSGHVVRRSSLRTSSHVNVGGARDSTSGHHDGSTTRIGNLSISTINTEYPDSSAGQGIISNGVPTSTPQIHIPPRVRRELRSVLTTLDEIEALVYANAFRRAPTDKELTVLSHPLDEGQVEDVLITLDELIDVLESCAALLGVENDDEDKTEVPMGAKKKRVEKQKEEVRRARGRWEKVKEVLESLPPADEGVYEH